LASLLPSASPVCIDEFHSLCLDVTSDGAGTLAFNATCSPSPGSSTVTWCGFGFSTSSFTTMFPAEIVALQAAADGRVWLEDRCAAAGYTLPPCFAEQASVLVAGARDARGVLRAAWTRAARVAAPLLAAGYIDLVGNLTAIGALSADGAPAAGVCADYMTPHTLVQPGVAFALPP
jgi:hypothetical protein